jgi:xanthine dehydrogenase YagR molybdenum-binding subunit
VWCGLSVGRIRQEGPATAQCHGAVIQALGQTLFERRRVDERTGAVVSTSLDDYELPGLADVPDIRVSFLPGGFEHAAHGGAGLAEVAGLATTASVGNAVAAALGRRCHALPLTPDVILEECR